MQINNIGFLLDDDTIKLWKVIAIENGILILELFNDQLIIVRSYADNFWPILDYLI